MLGEIWGEILKLARLTPALWWRKWQARQGQDSLAAARLASWTLDCNGIWKCRNRKTKPKRPWGGRNASSPWEASLR